MGRCPLAGTGTSLHHRAMVEGLLPETPYLAHPNEPGSIRERAVAGLVNEHRVWWALSLRIGLGLTIQLLLFLGFLISGEPTPWRAAADWWLASWALAEAVNLWVLKRLSMAEGIRLRDLYNLGLNRRQGDLWWLATALIVAAILGLFPNVVLAGVLWDDPQAAAEMTFRAVPVWAAFAMLGVFPVIHALTELPTYFGYVMPRLGVFHGGSMALVITAAVLSAQHVFMPLLLDGRYVAWRLLMFLPLALWFGWVIKKRPVLLPYLVVAHALLDLSLPLFVIQASLA